MLNLVIINNLLSLNSKKLYRNFNIRLVVSLSGLSYVLCMCHILFMIDKSGKVINIE